MAGGLCFASGPVPVDHAGNHLAANDLTGHVAHAFAHLDSCLADQGLALSDLIPTTTSLREIPDASKVSAARGSFLRDHRGATILMGWPTSPIRPGAAPGELERR
jgi:enamine deaminase RidA (YjgF/YER057c/UK114 family)